MIALVVADYWTIAGTECEQKESLYRIEFLNY